MWWVCVCPGVSVRLCVSSYHRLDCIILIICWSTRAAYSAALCLRRKVLLLCKSVVWMIWIHFVERFSHFCSLHLCVWLIGIANISTYTDLSIKYIVQPKDIKLMTWWIRMTINSTIYDHWHQQTYGIIDDKFISCAIFVVVSNGLKTVNGNGRSGKEFGIAIRILIRPWQIPKFVECSNWCLCML